MSVFAFALYSFTSARIRACASPCLAAKASASNSNRRNAEDASGFKNTRKTGRISSTNAIAAWGEISAVDEARRRGISCRGGIFQNGWRK